MTMTKDEWIENTARFYFKIFSENYHNDFLAELLKGGGGNWALCGSWMKLSSNFLTTRISGKALESLQYQNFPLTKVDETVVIKKEI